MNVEFVGICKCGHLVAKDDAGLWHVAKINCEVVSPTNFVCMGSCHAKHCNCEKAVLKTKFGNFLDKNALFLEEEEPMEEAET